MSYNKSKILVVTWILALFVLVYPQKVLCQFTVSPVIIETTGYPGGLRTFTFSIGNTGKETLDCTINTSAMEISSGGMAVQVDDSPRSCSSWIEVEPSEFTLPPQNGRKIVCTLRIPRDTGGGYYAIISCNGIPITGTDESTTESGIGGGIRFRYRSLVPVLLTVPAPQMQAVIEASEPNISKLQQGNGYVFKLPVRNTGNVHAKILGTVEIRSEAEQLVDKFEMVAGRGFILPDHERLFENRGTVNMPDGIYTMRIRLDVEGSGRPMQNAFPFYIRNGNPEIAELSDELKNTLLKESAGFIVSPAELNLSLRAGGRRSQAIELINLTRDTIKIQSELLNWYRTPDGNDIIDTEITNDRSGLSYLELRDKEIELRPLSRRRIQLTASLSKQAIGEYYAAVMFDRSDVQLDNSPSGRIRRSTKIRVSAQDTGSISGEIIKLEASRRPNGIIDFDLRCKNTGNVGFIPDVSFRILNEDDNEIGKVNSTSRPMLIQASSESVIRAEWERVLDPGKYKVEVTFRPSQNQPPLVERSDFIVPSISSISN